MPPFTTHYTQCCHPERIRSVSVTPKKNFTRVLYILPLLCLFYLPSAGAEHTRTWRQASYEDFLKGTPHGVAVRSDGRLASLRQNSR